MALVRTKTPVERAELASETSMDLQVAHYWKLVREGKLMHVEGRTPTEMQSKANGVSGKLLICVQFAPRRTTPSAAGDDGSLTTW